MKNKLSCIIPCYCSENTIANVVASVRDVIDANEKYDYEIICVNDGSKDNTLATLQALAKENRCIKVINLSKNFGQHAAVLAGFTYATGDIFVCLDDDGETPANEIFSLIDKMETGGYDVVSARYGSDHRGIVRKVGTRVSMMMSHAMVGMPSHIEINSFLCMRRFVAMEMIKYQNAYPFIAGLILRVTRNIADVEITRNERIAGSSHYSFKKLFALWLNGFTAFSEKPLRLASIFGALCAGGGILDAFVIIIKKYLGNITVSGYTSIMAAILIFSGVIMLFLGLIGEYIGRIYICLNEAPQFVVKDTYNV